MGGFIGGVAWSPDGSTIAFTSTRHAKPQHSEIYAINADGTSLRQLTRYPDAVRVNRNPVWSPDGRTIAYQHGSSIWKMDGNGGSQRPLTPDRLYTDPEASWSPDSRTIAYARSGSIYLVGADGENLRRIT
jgi:Tol biopolymer transport system component